MRNHYLPFIFGRKYDMEEIDGLTYAVGKSIFFEKT
jgi:hypothetical protein